MNGLFLPYTGTSLSSSGSSSSLSTLSTPHPSSFSVMVFQFYLWFRRLSLQAIFAYLICFTLLIVCLTLWIHPTTPPSSSSSSSATPTLINNKVDPTKSTKERDDSKLDFLSFNQGLNNHLRDDNLDKLNGLKNLNKWNPKGENEEKPDDGSSEDSDPEEDNQKEGPKSLSKLFDLKKKEEEEEENSGFREDSSLYDDVESKDRARREQEKRAEQLRAGSNKATLGNILDSSAERFTEVLAQVLVQKMKVTEPPPPPAKLNGPCDHVERNVDRYRYDTYNQFWKNLPEQLVEGRKRSFHRWLEKTPHRPPSIYNFSGRGIVTLAGNGDTFLRALALVRILKFYGCKLPVEVWYAQDELNVTQRGQIAALGAVPRDASDSSLPLPMKKVSNTQKNFHLKAAVILNSSFKEVLYLDSDNIPVADPTSMFERPAYKLAGAVFWPDFWKTAKDNPIWDILGIECVDEWEQESGQILVDKERHWRPLNIAYFLCRAHAFYYQLINGDKDTFRFAFKALNVSYAWPNRWLASAGRIFEGKFCGSSMVQADIPTAEELEALRPGQSKSNNLEDLLEEDLDATPRYMFIHANLIKEVPQSFLGQNPGPWEVLKRYKVDISNTYLKPIMWSTKETYSCMELTSTEGESEAVTTPFDDVFPGFRERYFALGGPGGNPDIPIVAAASRSMEPMVNLPTFKM